MPMPFTVRALQPADRAAWEPLWRAYLAFYETELPAEIYDLTWSRFHDPAEPMHAFGAFEKTGVLVGITHAIFHRSCWLAESTCYLQEPLCRCEPARQRLWRGADRGRRRPRPPEGSRQALLVDAGRPHGRKN